MLLFGLHRAVAGVAHLGLLRLEHPAFSRCWQQAAMVVSALAFLPATLRGKTPETTPGQPLWRQFFHQITPLPIVLFTALIVAYMLTLEPLGFIISSFAFLVASMYALGDRRIVRVSIVSAVSLAIIYVIFQTAFSVVLPEGLLRGII